MLDWLASLERGSAGCLGVVPSEHALVEGGLEPLAQGSSFIADVIDPLLQGDDRGSQLLHVARAPRRKLAVDPLHITRVGHGGRLEVKPLLETLAPVRPSVPSSCGRTQDAADLFVINLCRGLHAPERNTAMRAAPIL